MVWKRTDHREKKEEEVSNEHFLNFPKIVNVNNAN